VKFIDVCWGFGGWVTLGTTFGEALNDRVLAITSATVVLLVITDIWCPILFYVVYDLLNLYKREVEVIFPSFPPPPPPPPPPLSSLSAPHPHPLLSITRRTTSRWKVMTAS
jgi:hypothetical protein